MLNMLVEDVSGELDYVQRLWASQRNTRPPSRAPRPPFIVDPRIDTHSGFDMRINTVRIIIMLLYFCGRCLLTIYFELLFLTTFFFVFCFVLFFCVCSCWIILDRLICRIRCQD